MIYIISPTEELLQSARRSGLDFDPNAEFVELACSNGLNQTLCTRCIVPFGPIGPRMNVSESMWIAMQFDAIAGVTIGSCPKCKILHFAARPISAARSWSAA